MKFEKEEALRYMGIKGKAEADVLRLLEKAEESLKDVAAPRHAALRIPVLAEGDQVFTPAFSVTSPALAKHLAPVKEAFLFAATLGADVDRLMARYTKVDMAFAFALQAAAASALECYADDVTRSLLLPEEVGRVHLLPRFSPGYGGFPIEFQTEILAALSADRRIGLSETASHMLTPLKSITAVIGITNKAPRCAEHKCALCPNTGCAYRKEP